MQVSQEAWIFLGIEAFLFLILLYSLFRANKNSVHYSKDLAGSCDYLRINFEIKTIFQHLQAANIDE